MNSVVSRDIDAYSVVAGHPIKFIGKRFDDELIDIMEKLQWWDLPLEKINDLIPILSCSDLEKVEKY